MAQIQQAPPEKTNLQLAEELGLHRNTVGRYRAEARAERKAIAAEVLHNTAVQEMPNALAALGEALETARAQMKATKHPDFIRETRACSVAMLQFMGKPEGDPDELAGISDEQLKATLRERGVL